MNAEDKGNVTLTNDTTTMLNQSVRKYIVNYNTIGTTQTAWIGEELFLPVDSAVRLTTGLPVISDSTRLDFCLQLTNQNAHGSQTIKLAYAVPGELPADIFNLPGNYEQKTFNKYIPRLEGLKK